MTDTILLRDVIEADLPVFFRYECEPEAAQMAAFTPKDPTDHEAFTAHWRKVLAAPGVIVRTIVRGEEVLGSVLSYEESGKPEVTYWIGSDHWGQGVATEALRQFLATVDTRRPMRARAAKDNVASIRVLEKCGFRVIEEARGFANARGEEIDELVLELSCEALPDPLEARPGVARERSAEYYDEQAVATAWFGSEVVFGLMYRAVEPGESLLDLGVGTGLSSALFAEAGLRVTGMDLDEEMLRGVRGKGLAERLVQHDLSVVPYPFEDGSFDHAICVGVLQFLESPADVFNEAGRVLRDGGTFAFTVIDRGSGEPSEITVGREHTADDREVTMYRHTASDVLTPLEASGFQLEAELGFTAYMDAERKRPLALTAFVARRHTRGE